VWNHCPYPLVGGVIVSGIVQKHGLPSRLQEESALILLLGAELEMSRIRNEVLLL